MKHSLNILFLLIAYFLTNINGFTQCVMCSATIEATKQDGGLTGAGINVGVGYLSFFPYLILGFFGFIFYKIYKKDKEQDNQ